MNNDTSLRYLADTFKFLAGKAFLRADANVGDDQLRAVFMSRGLAYRVAADLTINLIDDLASERAAAAAWWEDEQNSHREPLA